jgi:heme A synthase
VVVVLQGLLGGLRVTGHLTLSTSAADMAPSLALAAVHGVLGQLFLALVVVLAAACNRHWKAAPAPIPTTATDRALHHTLLALLLLQLVLGALQRHFAQGLMVHISLAVVVSLVAAFAGARALDGKRWPLRRIGSILLGLLGAQLLLGVAALAVTRGQAVVGNPGTLEATVATAHQACGAALLASSVLLAAWSRRLLRPAEV